MSWLSKTFKKITHVVQKVAAPLGVAAGAIIGGPAGASIGGQIGGMIGGLGSGGGGSTVPQITSPTPSVMSYQPTIGTPGINGGAWGGLNPLDVQLGATVYRDGTARTADGRIINDKNLVSEIYGSPSKPYNDDNGSSATPLLFGLGALLLLSD